MATEEIEIDISPDSWKNIRINEILITQRGDKWIFHKYDKDKFPSSPHGHNKITGEKLDINTGACYNPANNIITRSLKEKDLIKLRQKLKDEEII